MLLSVLKWAGGKILLPALLFGAAYFAGRHAGELAERVIWQANSAQAQLAALKAKDAVEQTYATITKRHSDEIQTARDAARADALRYVASLRASSGVHVDLPEFAAAAAGVDGAGRDTFVDDTRICADAVVKAEGWQAWWRSVQSSNNR